MSNALAVIAQNSGTSPEEIKDVISGMIVSAKAQHGAKATDAELAVVAGVCATYSLNPLVKEAYAFISGGKLQVMIGIDGWLKIMNRHPEFDGVEFDYEWDGKKLLAVTTKIYTKSRKHPVSVTEWMDECKQPKSDAWNKYEKRMLRNKSLGQCIRVAFGISEILDDDEADRIKAGERDITPHQSRASVDYQCIEKSAASCNDVECLRVIFGDIRSELEKAGTWNKERPVINEIYSRHKARIEELNSASTIDAEFEEVSEEVKNDTAAEPDNSSEPIEGESTVEFE